ncbi:uncharacterized protein [Clytia hemisphaerica]|uniref:uncharacterized protein n=1 Tax=Clytia hemisphaerica TaxID=252671 RepID=UPI0034D4ECD0|eukprot:TCONS_00058078-protein
MIDVPFIAMTATATMEMKKFIICNLDLTEPLLLVQSPEKPNIKYNLIELPHKNIEFIFMPLVNYLKEKFYDADKFIIFCRTIDDTRPIYQLFRQHIKVKNPTLRPYAKFHAKTEGDLKRFLSKEFTDPKSRIRILMATMAYGMGVDCKGLYDVIHFGPPKDLDDYFQESGRAGRDGCLSNSTVIKYKRALNPSCLSPEIKQYCNNQSDCRRKLLLSQFQETPYFPSITPKHQCCDICHRQCDCGTCVNEHEHPWYIREITDSIQKLRIKCSLNENGKSVLKEKLVAFQSQITSVSKGGLLNGKFSSGFPDQSIEEIINIASELTTSEMLIEHTSLTNNKFFEEIISQIQEVLTLPDCKLDNIEELEYFSDNNDLSVESENELNHDASADEIVNDSGSDFSDDI